MSFNNIINFHAHIYPENISERATQSVSDGYGIKMDYNGTLEQLIEDGKKSGVTQFAVQSVAVTPKTVQSINNFIAKKCSKNPDILFGLGTLHPDMENPEEEIERCISLGLKGIKLHPDSQRFLMDSDKAMRLYEMLEGRLPILMHCGDYRFQYSRPERLANVLDAFPKLTVVAAHFGGWSLWDLALEYLEDKNCYLDTSSSMMYLGQRRSKELIKAYGAERMLFGTDYPMWNSADDIEMLEKMELSQNEYESIFRKNALKVLNIEEESK